MELDLAEVAELFQAEAAESLEAAEQALVALEESPGDAEAVATVFRVFHTIKGNASSLAYHGVAQLAHGLEDALHSLREHACPASPGLVALLLRGIDALSAGLRAAAAGRLEPTRDQEELLAEVSAGVAGASTASAGRAGRPPGPRDAAPAPGTATVAVDQSLRVDLRKLGRMLDLTGEIAIAQGRLAQALGSAGSEDAVAALHECMGLSADLQELVMQARLVPLGPVFRRYARTVRDLAAAHGRVARLAIEGAEVEVDTSVVEHIRDPLTHMIRNAIDHGIEAPEARREAGKDPVGTLVLRALRDSGSLVIELADDGAGLDPARILARARAKGLVPGDVTPTASELCNLVFEPGFSTADNVSELSGRGVGLDVVRRNVEALRGCASIESTPGRGATVSLRLPLTLAIIPGLNVEAAGETFVVPLDSVVECLDAPAHGGRGDDRLSTLELRGSSLPCVRLGRLFAAALSGGREQAVVVRQGGGLAGLIVDRVVGESQTVIKPLGPLFRAARWFSGATVLGDGRVAPILDVSALVQHATSLGGGRSWTPHPNQGGKPLPLHRGTPGIDASTGQCGGQAVGATGGPRPMFAVPNERKERSQC